MREGPAFILISVSAINGWLKQFFGEIGFTAAATESISDRIIFLLCNLWWCLYVVRVIVALDKADE